MADEQISRRPRVLQVAYACSPTEGSEPCVGWNRAVEAARHCDVCVITEGNEFRHQIDDYIALHGEITGLQFEYVHKTPRQEALSRIPGMYYPAYRAWHQRAFEVAGRLHRENRFDLVHQVNMCGYREPGFLWKLDAPFVWGPIGGTQNYPWRFLSIADFRGGLGEAIRGIGNNLQLRHSSRVRRAAEKADKLLVANSTNKRDFERAHRCETTLMLETGISSMSEPRTRSSRTDGPLRILWVGEFRTWKALPLLIMALGQVERRLRFELRVVGAGPLEKAWKREAERASIDASVQWLGWLPRTEVAKQYGWADVLAFTSLRDTSGNVVLEALANGVPVVCLDHQGVRDMVDDRSGIKIPVTAPTQVARELGAALELISADTETLVDLSQGALDAARRFLWTEQGRRMTRVYQQVLGDGFDWTPRSTDAWQTPGEALDVPLLEVVL